MINYDNDFYGWTLEQAALLKRGQWQTDENGIVRFRWRPTVKRYQRLVPKQY
jgi:hypothetical protein